MTTTIMALWAGAESSDRLDWTVENNKLPSPIDVEITREQIWDENAGRVADGTMKATYVASKRTYAIKWGILTGTEFQKILDLLTTGFFKFGEGTSDTKPSSVGIYYRSEISYSPIQTFEGKRYKDVSVSVIQK